MNATSGIRRHIAQPMAPSLNCPCGKKFATEGYLTRHHNSGKCEHIRQSEQRIRAAALREKTTGESRAKRRRIELAGSLDNELSRDSEMPVRPAIREESQQRSSGSGFEVRLIIFHLVSVILTLTRTRKTMAVHSQNHSLISILTRRRRLHLV